VCKFIITSCDFRGVGATETPKLRAVVTGSGGLLGRSLVSTLRDEYEVVGLDIHESGTCDGVKVDITQKQQTMESIAGISPSVVVHAAAETNVDRCETDRDLAKSVNVAGTANIAEVCAKIRAKLIFISTDYVFDGVRGDYAETDEPNPVNFYGLTKLEAERVVANISPKSLVVRTSVLFGWHPTRLNYATWVLKGLREHQALNVVTDHVNSPTLNLNLAEAIKMAIEHDSEGILHVAGSERISRFDFALKIAERFDLDGSLLVPVKMDELGWVAKRPRDSSLRVQKAEKELGVELFGVDRSLEEMARSGP
jgi:dTDP-4-dehydrorhamnose reductase